MKKTNLNVRYQMLKRAAETVNTLNDEIEAMKSEYVEAVGKNEEERSYWEEDIIRTYPDKIEAYEKLVEYMENI